MTRIQTFFVLVLCTGNSESWFWFSDQVETKTESPTEFPTEALTTNASTTPVGTTATTITASNAMKMEEEEDNLSGMGPEILDMASGMRELVEALNTSRKSDGATGRDPNSTGNASAPRGEGEREGSGSAWAPTAGAGSGGGSVVVLNSTSVVAVAMDPPLSPCLPVPPDWPICLSKRPQSLTLPNHFNHTSVDQVGEVLREWAWLVEKGCHPSAEWFLCLLLVPGCPGPAPLPCRSSCQMLRDSCWASLDRGRLPVACQDLPDVAPESSRPACVYVSNWKGNLGGWERFQPDVTSVLLLRTANVALACFSHFQRNWLYFTLFEKNGNQ